jgi:hypothetical protein
MARGLFKIPAQTSSRQFPALAAVAARAASAGSAAVMFNVTHFGAGNGSTPPAPLIDFVPPTEMEHVATETLAFHPAAAGFQVHTWAPDSPHKPVAGVSINRISVSPRIDERGAYRHLYCGSVVINPNFLYDSAHSTEILITIGYDPWRPDYADSLMITRIFHGMTLAAATDGGVPVLFMQSPVAPFRDPSPKFREDGSGEAPRVANGMALRMLVGLDDANPLKRIAFLRTLTELAQSYGLGLQIADARFGRVRGEWWSVVAPNQGKYNQRKEELFGWAPQGVPRAVQLVTFVGPARVGSSAAIAADFLARNVGMVALSAATLQEIAFINLMVPIAPARLTDTAPSGTCLPITEGIGQLASDCGLTRRQGVRARTQISVSSATDYQVLSTGPVTPAITVAADAVEHPLWLSWAVPLESDAAKRPPDVAALVMAQLCEAGDRVAGARIDYYRVRVLADGRVKGRAKISVALLEEPAKSRIPTLLSELCPWAQREVIATLVRDHIPLRAIQLRLAWRERWLGRASMVM